MTRRYFPLCRGRGVVTGMPRTRRFRPAFAILPARRF